MNHPISLCCDVCGARIPLCIEQQLPGGINPDVMVFDTDRGFVCGQCRAAFAALTGVFASIFAGTPK